MLLATLAFAASLVQDDKLAQQVDFTANAATVQLALAKLSQKTGTELTVSGPIAKDIVVLQFTGVSLKEAMAKIADATTSEWRPTKEGYRLERTAAVVQRYQEAIRSRCASFLRDDLAKTAKTFLETDGASQAQIAEAISKIPQGWSDDEEPPKVKVTATDEKILAQTPGQRLLLRIAESIGVKRMAAIAESGKRTIYALPATRRQEPIAADAAIARFVKDHNVWAHAAAALGPDTLESRFLLGHFHSLQQTVIRGPLSKVFVRVESGRTPGSTLSFELYVFDSQRMWVDYDWLELLTGPPEKPMDYDDEPAKRDPEKPIQLSHDAQLLANLFEITLEEKAALEDPALLAKLRRPDKFEPLSLMASEMMLKTAEAKKENLAACLLDDAFEDMATLADLASLKPAWMLRLLPSRGYRCSEQDGWIVCHPEDPVESTKKRADRAAIARLVATGLQNQRLTMDDWAAYAIACPFDEIGLGPSIVGCTVKSSRYENIDNWNTLRFYGSLSTYQRSLLDDGKRLAFREMSPAQRAIVDELAYDEMGGVSLDLSDAPDVKDIRHVLNDPTQLLPEGVDPDGYLEMITVRENALYRVPCKETEDRTFGIDDVFGFAMRLQAIEGAEPLPPDPGHLQLGTQVQRDFHLNLGGDRICRVFLSDSYAPPGPEYTLETLPDNIKKELKEAAEYLKKHPPVSFGGGGG